MTLRLPLLIIAFLLIVQTSYGADTRADYILIEKSKHQLTLFKKRKIFRTFSISIGKGGLAPKEIEGDNLTPEGIYKIDGRNAKSGFYKALHINYPNPSDIKRAQQKGKSPGGNILIHGLKNGLGWIGRFHLFIDWTQGCIAVTNQEIDEIWAWVPDGTLLEITK